MGGWGVVCSLRPGRLHHVVEVLPLLLLVELLFLRDGCPFDPLCLSTTTRYLVYLSSAGVLA